MPARFFCQTGTFAGSSFEIADEVVIGRNEDDVRLPADIVSGTHARIYFDADRGSYFLEDLGSRNGTKLDGMPVTEPVKLGPLHIVTFANQIDFIYHEGTGQGAREVEAPAAAHTQPEGFTPAAIPIAGAAAESRTASDSNTIRTDAYQPGALPSQDKPATNETVRTDAYTPGALPVADADDEAPTLGVSDDAPADGGQQTRLRPAFTPTPNLPGSTSTPTPPTPSPEPSVRFSIEVTRGDRSVTFPLSEGENVVGRASNCDVSIDDKSVSRRHALLTVRDGRVMLRDLGSRNHSFLDGERADSEVEVPLGAVLRFGIETEAKLRRA